MKPRELASAWLFIAGAATLVLVHASAGGEGDELFCPEETCLHSNKNIASTTSRVASLACVNKNSGEVQTYPKVVASTSSLLKEQLQSDGFHAAECPVDLEIKPNRDDLFHDSEGSSAMRSSWPRHDEIEQQRSKTEETRIAMQEKRHATLSAQSAREEEEEDSDEEDMPAPSSLDSASPSQRSLDEKPDPRKVKHPYRDNPEIREAFDVEERDQLNDENREMRMKVFQQHLAAREQRAKRREERFTRLAMSEPGIPQAIQERHASRAREESELSKKRLEEMREREEFRKQRREQRNAEKEARKREREEHQQSMIRSHENRSTNEMPDLPTAQDMHAEKAGQREETKRRRAERRKEGEREAASQNKQFEDAKSWEDDGDSSLAMPGDDTGKRDRKERRDKSKKPRRDREEDDERRKERKSKGANKKRGRDKGDRRGKRDKRRGMGERMHGGGRGDASEDDVHQQYQDRDHPDWGDEDSGTTSSSSDWDDYERY